MGITPRTGYMYRDKFPGCSDFTGQPADFVKWCYDRSTTNFKAGVSEVYKYTTYYIVYNQQIREGTSACCLQLS